jgi:ABC-type uncharacterized transport system permease subunit
VIVYSKFLQQEDEKAALRSDFCLLIGSMIAMVACFTYWMDSLKLGIWSLVIILLSLGSSMCISRGLFKVSYRTMESIALEILATIGVSTVQIFLIFDAWNQSSMFKSFYRN